MKPVNYEIQPKELRVFYQSWQSKHPDVNALEEKVIKLVKKALNERKSLLLKKEDWEVFKVLKFKLMGSSPLAIQVVEERLGIKGVPDETADVYSSSTLDYLFTSLKEDNLIALDPTEKRLLLKALAHFATTDKGLVLDHQDALRLYALGARFSQRGLAGDSRIDPLKFLQKHYAELKGVQLSEEELKASERVNELLAQYAVICVRLKDIVEGEGTLSDEDVQFISQVIGREVSREELTTLYHDLVVMEKETNHGYRLPGSSQVDPFKRQELMEKGEGLRREATYGLGKIFAGLREIKEAGPTRGAAVNLLMRQISVEKVKLQALADYYRPHVRDRNFSFLYAKTLLDLDKLLSVQEILTGHPQPERKALIAQAQFFLERARLLGINKAAILQSQLIREQQWNGQESYKKAMRHLIPADDVEVQIEKAYLHGRAGNYKEALEILKPIGRRGGDALSALFQAGSKEAGEELLGLVRQKLSPEFLRTYYWERFVAAIVTFFSFGFLSNDEIEKGAFFNRHPQKLSKREVDFLVQKRAVDTLQEFIDKGFGPRYRLVQALERIQALPEEEEEEVVSLEEASSSLVPAHPDETAEPVEVGSTALVINHEERRDEQVHLILTIGGHRYQAIVSEADLPWIKVVMEAINPSPEKAFSARPEQFSTLVRHIRESTFPLRRSLGSPEASPPVREHLSVSTRVEAAVDNVLQGQSAQSFFRRCYEALPNGTLALTAAGIGVAVLTYVLSSGIGGAAAAASLEGALEEIDTTGWQEVAVNAPTSFPLTAGGGWEAVQAILRHGPQLAMRAMALLRYR